MNVYLSVLKTFVAKVGIGGRGEVERVVCVARLAAQISSMKRGRRRRDVYSGKVVDRRRATGTQWSCGEHGAAIDRVLDVVWWISAR